MKPHLFFAVIFVLMPCFSTNAQVNNGVWKSRIAFSAGCPRGKGKQSVGALMVNGIKTGKISATYNDKDNHTNKVTNAYLDKIFVPQLMKGSNGRATLLDFTPDSITRYAIEADWVYNVKQGKMEMRLLSVTPYLMTAIEPVTYMDEGLEQRSKAIFKVSYADFSKIVKQNDPEVLEQFTGAIWNRYFDNDSINLNGSYNTYVSNITGYYDIHYHQDYPMRIRTDTLLNELLLNAAQNGMKTWDINSDPLEKQLTADGLLLAMYPKVDTTSAPDYVIWQQRQTYKNGQRVFDYSSVTSYNVVYDWTFNYLSGKADIKLIAIAPRQNIYMEDGSQRGSTPMFWIKYNDARPYFDRIGQYYPENSLELQAWRNMISFREMRLLQKNK